MRVWAQKCSPDVVVLGVHTPEFAFEQNVDNVGNAVQQLKVTYPIVLDSDYAISRTFDNHYWPALYFVDARGRVREHHFVEGEYERSEATIQRLLTEGRIADIRDGGSMSVEAGGVEVQADWANLRSPEEYLAYQRTEHFASPGGMARDRVRRYAFPARLDLIRWALAGDWTTGPQAAGLNSVGGRIACRFHARDLHLVTGPPPPESRVRFRVSIDGQPPGSARGVDVDTEGKGTVAEPRVYQLIRQPNRSATDGSRSSSSTPVWRPSRSR